MVIGFFELRLSGILRFPLWLQPGLKANSPRVTAVYFYEQIDCDVDEVISRLPENTRLVKVTKISRVGKIYLDSIYHNFVSRAIVEIFLRRLVGLKKPDFQKWTFLKMSKSEISEIVFSEEIQIFPYAVKCSPVYLVENSTTA